jgi:hypothetical protein
MPMQPERLKLPGHRLEKLSTMRRSPIKKQQQLPRSGLTTRLKLGRGPVVLWRGILAALVIAAGPSCCCGYSLLTHEEVVDILWKDEIEPLLLKRYPSATPPELRTAHAYAYGGSLVQDIGYYPFGSKFFSNLAHGVRTGDFVMNLLHGATNLDEYAFALGALEHYTADNCGHPYINQAAAIYFPKLRAKYGDRVTYEDSPKAHLRTEFGFDVTQVAKQRYTTDSYHDFIGFEVAKPLLVRAFYATYGLTLEEGLGHVDLAIGTFRHAVSQVIPEMTRAAWSAYHPESVQEKKDFQKELFLYHLARAQYEREWGREYEKPGLLARLLGWIERVMPKVGFLSALAFKTPTPETEDLYLHSVNKTVATYRLLLHELGEENLRLEDTNLDTGRPAEAGEYALSDETYAQLLEALVKRGLADVPPDVRTDILAFFDNTIGERHTHRQKKMWARVEVELEALREGPNSPIAREVRQQLLAPPRRLESPKAKDS